MCVCVCVKHTAVGLGEARLMSNPCATPFIRDAACAWCRKEEAGEHNVTLLTVLRLSVLRSGHTLSEVTFVILPISLSGCVCVCV